MMQQVLAPGMKNTEKADLGSQVFRIGSNLQESSGADSKQKCVHQFLVMKRQRRKGMGDRENHVQVRNSQEFLLTGGQPLPSRSVQTLRAMPVAAAVVRDGDYMTTLRTTVPVPSERCCPTTLNGGKYLQVQGCQPRPIILNETFPCRSNDVRHLERWPHHWGCFLPECLTSATSDTASWSSGFGQARKWRCDKCK